MTPNLSKIIDNSLKAIAIVAVVFGFFFISIAVNALFYQLNDLPQDHKLLVNLLQEFPNKRLLVMLGQILGAILGLLILPLVYIMAFHKELLLKFMNLPKMKIQNYAMAVMLVFIALPLVGYLGEINKKMVFPIDQIHYKMLLMEEMASMLIKQIVVYNNSFEMILVVLAIAILPAVCEEFLFRGLLQNRLEKILENRHAAVWGSAFIFSFVHFQFFGFFPRLILGAVMGYLYIYTRNLSVAIIFHFVNNFFAVFTMNLYLKGKIDIDPESGEGIGWYLAMFSAILVGYVIYYIFKINDDIESQKIISN